MKTEASLPVKSPKNYVTTRRLTERELFNRACELLEEKLTRGQSFCNPNTVKDFLRFKLAPYEREVFGVMLLDSQHQLLEFRELFYGTINAAPVYPREVVKAVIETNAAAVIFAHNHPSGVAEPSDADKRVTERLKTALNTIDVATLDHIVVGKETVSFAERGLL
ncbi:DNA repair protein RadC [Aliidiomarina halalkaliphila]|uniref:DNA repair protein RadC n=1 Tax=Aliidiomarina halalkaliphila TaxID=2593535 RepID=A0A552X098_9GAMM|nr:DNA repair protein RadC [Aliidiomarina halalkaliphila]TRW48355.1 DNA repair protein RadC [Aliidiomarina halalkaliphila]